MTASDAPIRTMLRTDDDSDASALADSVDGLPLSTDALFDKLASAERRRVLRRLRDSEFMMPLADLAAGAVALEADEDPGVVTDDEALESAKIRLHHVHVPALADAGLVDYDTRSNMVALTAAGERVARRLPVDGE